MRNVSTKSTKTRSTAAKKALTTTAKKENNRGTIVLVWRGDRIMRSKLFTSKNSADYRDYVEYTRNVLHRSVTEVPNTPSNRAQYLAVSQAWQKNKNGV